MLALNVELRGDKIVLSGLRELAVDLPRIAQGTVRRIAAGVYRRASDWLGGAGAKASNVPSGGYPVPVRTKHLLGSLGWVAPGASKSSNGLTFAAGPMEAIVYDSALYAWTVHEGRGSSAKFGRRPFLEDAFKDFNASGKIVAIAEAEVKKAIAAKGLA